MADRGLGLAYSQAPLYTSNQNQYFLHGAARALALAAWQVGTGRTLLVLCRSDEVAAALAQDLAFFLGGAAALLPEREDDLEAHAGRVEARAGRVEALHRLVTRRASVLVASVAAALPRTIGPAALQSAVVSLYPQRIAPREDVLVEEKVQEAKQKQSQVDLTEMERQRQEQIESIRRRRAAAAREAELAEQRLQQLANVRSRDAAQTVARADSQASGNQGVDEGLQARYQAALFAAVRAKWTRPDSVALGSKCMVRIRQLPGGTVMSAEVSEPCAYDEQGRRSIEAAVLKAQPLPYAGFEKVFSRDLEIEFTAQAR